MRISVGIKLKVLWRTQEVRDVSNAQCLVSTGKVQAVGRVRNKGVQELETLNSFATHISSHAMNTGHSGIVFTLYLESINMF